MDPHLCGHQAAVSAYAGNIRKQSIVIATATIISLHFFRLTFILNINCLQIDGGIYIFPMGIGEKYRFPSWFVICIQNIQGNINQTNPLFVLQRFIISA